MKKLFLLPLAACLLVACPGPVDNGEGGGGGGTGKTPVVFNYDAIKDALEGHLTDESQSTYIQNEHSYTVGGLAFAARGGKYFGRVTNQYGGSEGYYALKSLQIKKAGGDVVTVTGLDGYTTITVVNLTTYTDNTIDKFLGIKVAGAAVTANETTLTAVATGQENIGSGDNAGKTFPVYRVTVTYTIAADATSFVMTAPANNAAYVESVTIA